MSRVSDLDLPVLGGALCLDFVNTIDPRHREPREEFIGSYSELARWASFIGTLQPSEVEALLHAARARTGEAERVHARALELREALYAIFTPHAASSRGASLGTLEQEWRGAMAHATLEPAAGGFRRGWEDSHALDRILWPVVASAVDLLCSPRVTRVRECDGDGCGWLFVDTSKTQRRRWCSMAICGNREKARRHRQRTHSS